MLGHPDVGVDRAERADLDEQSVLRRVRPGHVARHVQPHAQLRPPLRVRGRHQGVAGSLADRVRSGRARWRSRDLAQAAYARNPIPQVPVSEFRVLGGSVYAGAPGASGLSWKGESMWMPRVSGAYTLGERTVIKGGYGLFFDTLNAGDYAGFNQLGYSSTTTNVVQHGLRPDLAAGRSEERHLAAGRSVPGARRRRPVRAADRRFARRRRHSRHELHARGSQSQAPAGAALADRRAAGAAAQPRRRGRLLRLLRRPRRPEHQRSLRAGAVLQQRDQRPRRDAAGAAAAAGAESVPHQQLRVAGDDQPGALCADGGQRVLHRGDGAAADPAARLPAARPA